MIRVIRAIRSLVDSVFMQKYVIEVYVSMSFCLRAIRVIRSLVDSVFMQKYVIEVYVSMSFCLRAIRVIRSLVDSVFMQKYVIEVYVSMSFCLLSHSVCQMFSQSASQSGINSVRINGFLACKRCPLRRLLTPFWSPIKHLLKSVFATA